MPRIKEPHTPPVTIANTLERCIITFVNPQTSSITSNHPGLAQKTFNQLKSDIADCGGAYVGTVVASTHLVATQDQFEKNGAKIKQATKTGIYIVTYDWLVDCLNSDRHANEANYLLSTTALATPAPDSTELPVPNSRHSMTQVSNNKAKRGRSGSGDEEESPAKKLKSTVLDTLKPSTKFNRQVPVDDFYMQERKKPETTDKACRVYQSNGVIYDATLNQTDSANNANKFYRIQLLEYGNGNYHTWTRWGRVGEGGQFKLLGNGDLRSAVSAFEQKFKDKTRNSWEDRDAFSAKAGKYALIEINYESSEGEDLPGAGGRRESKDSITSSSSSAIESKLPKPVASLMAFIFDQEYFDQSLKALNYDKEKMPLGKLSKRTLLDGYSVLRDLAGLIGTPGTDDQVTSLSDRYFSLIPHAFNRVTRPPVLSTQNLIKHEAEMLESLTDMQLTDEIMKSAIGKDRLEKLALADRQFQDLGLQEMTPLDPQSTEYKELAEYLVKSAGETHYSIDYNIQDIFRIERRQETDRFNNSSFSKIPKNHSDRRLLWHGSRSTNFGGILSQGLRIAPPEAPLSGFMFDKGVYLANMSTKSANYCWAEDSGNQGLLLLCEAELGKPSLKLVNADPNAASQSRAANCISTWGVGMTRPYGWKDGACVNPDLQGVIMPDVSMPFGPSDEGSSLLYDEFICYDIAQVRLRYLIRTGM